MTDGPFSQGWDPKLIFTSQYMYEALCVGLAWEGYHHLAGGEQGMEESIPL